MKIICTTERFIKEKKTCRKEYCCKKMEKAMESTEKNNHTYYSNFDLTEKDKITIKTHSSYDYDYEDMKEEIKFCLFCGKPVKVKREHVDRTNFPPKAVINPVKRKRQWWQRR